MLFTVLHAVRFFSWTWWCSRKQGLCWEWTTNCGKKKHVLHLWIIFNDHHKKHIFYLRAVFAPAVYCSSRVVCHSKHIRDVHRQNKTHSRVTCSVLPKWPFSYDKNFTLKMAKIVTFNTKTIYQTTTARRPLNKKTKKSQQSIIHSMVTCNRSVMQDRIAFHSWQKQCEQARVLVPGSVASQRASLPSKLQNVMSSHDALVSGKKA